MISNTEYKFKKSELRKLLAIQKWYKIQDKTNSLIWYNLTHEKLEEFILSDYTSTSTTSVSTVPTTPTVISTTNEFTIVIEDNFVDKAFSIVKNLNAL